MFLDFMASLVVYLLRGVRELSARPNHLLQIERYIGLLDSSILEFWPIVLSYNYIQQSTNRSSLYLFVP